MVHVFMVFQRAKPAEWLRQAFGGGFVGAVTWRGFPRSRLRLCAWRILPGVVVRINEASFANAENVARVGFFDFVDLGVRKRAGSFLGGF